MLPCGLHAYNIHVHMESVFIYMHQYRKPHVQLSIPQVAWNWICCTQCICVGCTYGPAAESGLFAFLSVHLHSNSIQYSILLCIISGVRIRSSVKTFPTLTILVNWNFVVKLQYPYVHY